MPDWIHLVWEIIYSGGPIMIALLALALLLYGNVFGLFLFTLRLNAIEAFEQQAPDHSRASVQDFRNYLSEMINAQLKYANVLIAAAPLLGLLGTVIGMLDTFKSIGSRSVEDTTVAVADGVKVALITTQTGLMIAIVGLFLTQIIRRVYRGKDQRLLELELETMRQALTPRTT